MGDIADWLFERYDYDDDDDDEPPSKRSDITCNRCGEGGLSWYQKGYGGYALGKGGSQHFCKTAGNVNDFEDLT